MLTKKWGICVPRYQCGEEELGTRGDKCVLVLIAKEGKKKTYHKKLTEDGSGKQTDFGMIWEVR